jgi:hypothetical protein
MLLELRQLTVPPGQRVLLRDVSSQADVSPLAIH